MCKVKKMLKKTSAFLTAAAVMATSLAVINRDDLSTAVLAAEGQVSNPVIYSDVPDPDIIRVGDTYYMISTTMFFNPGVPVMKSTDLVSWEICNYVYDTYHNSDKQNLVGNEHDYAHGSWAASLRYNKGTFYVFFGSYGSNK